MKHNLNYYIKNNYIVRNIVLALSVITIFLILVFVFLDLYTRHGQNHILPNLNGLTIEEAQELTSKMKLKLTISDSLFIPSQKGGVILDQNPKPGNTVKSKRSILLTVNSYVPKQVIVPYIAGFSLRQAKNKLVAEGLEIGKITYQEDIATNNVIEQRSKGVVISKNGKTTANIGDKVDIIVGINSSSSTLPVVPNLIGVSLSNAKGLLWENGFNIKDIIFEDDINYTNIDEAFVFHQSIHFGAIMNHGSEISFSITLNHEKLAEAKNNAQKMIDRINAINSKISGYNDTLSLIRGLKKEDDYQEMIYLDSTYYLMKIEELKQQLMLDNN